MAELAVYDNDPTLYLFTSLTAGSSHIITATSRIETILKANKIPFKGVDTATDELARKLYGRRARGKKLPLLVKEGFVIADLEQVEEWNEYDELKEALGAPAVPAPAVATPLAATKAPAAGAAATSAAVGASGAAKEEDTPKQTPEQNLAIRQLGAQAASVAAAKKPTPAKISTTNPLLASKASPSPSATTPSKPAASPSGILSPRSIPLPSTPANVAAGLKSPGVKSPLSPTSEFHGRKVESPSEEEIKLVEQQTAIAEVSSSEEEDDEDEEEDSEDEDEDEDEDEEEEKKPATVADKKVESVKQATTAAAAKEEDKTKVADKAEEKPQAQPAKAAEKAGVSVED